LKGAEATDVPLRSEDNFEDFVERHVVRDSSLMNGKLKISCSAGFITGIQALMMPRVISSPDHKASSIIVMVKFIFDSGFENLTTW